MLRIRSNGKEKSPTMEKAANGALVPGPIKERPVPAQFDGFMWSVEGVVVEDNFFTELKLGAFINTPVLTVEYREKAKGEWLLYRDVVRMRAEHENRVAGSVSPSSGPVSGPAIEAIIEAQKRGIYVGGGKTEQCMTMFDTDGTKHTSHCEKCAGMLSMQAVKAGHTTHEGAGERCELTGSETQEFLTHPPRTDG